MNIALLDFGTGNLHTLAKALMIGGARVGIESDPSAALAADVLVLPGVGAFGAAAARLEPHADALRNALLGGLPCLAVCVGMQLLFERSEEGGRGLGVLEGTVRAVRALRVPHMGWNVVEAGSDPLFAGLSVMHAYYANGFVVEPADGSSVIAWTEYGEDRFPAAVRRGATWGVQFHPEKSSTAGLRLIMNFLALAGQPDRARRLEPGLSAP